MLTHPCRQPVFSREIEAVIRVIGFGCTGSARARHQLQLLLENRAKRSPNGREPRLVRVEMSIELADLEIRSHPAVDKPAIALLERREKPLRCETDRVHAGSKRALRGGRPRNIGCESKGSRGD